MAKKNIVLSTQTTVPLYRAGLYLIVALDARKAAHKMANIFPCLVDEGQFDAMACYNYEDACFGLFFHKEKLFKRNIGHEMFHATMRVMHWAGDAFSIVHTEPYAFLNGWMHEYVYGQLKKAGLRVT